MLAGLYALCKTDGSLSLSPEFRRFARLLIILINFDNLIIYEKELLASGFDGRAHAVCREGSSC